MNYVYARSTSPRFIETPTEHDLHGKIKVDEPPPPPNSIPPCSTDSTEELVSLPVHKDRDNIFKEPNTKGK